MKKILNLTFFLALLFAGACSLNDQLAFDDQIKSKETIRGNAKKGGPIASAVIGGTSMNYYYKGATNNSIYRSNTTITGCSTISESIATLGNGALAPFGPAVVTFGGKLYLFHKGNTNNSIYYSTSTNGTTWSAESFLGNASTPGGVSAAVVNNIIYVTYVAVTQPNTIFISKSSNGTSWTETSTGLFNYKGTPWIIGQSGSSGNLLLCHVAVIGVNGTINLVIDSSSNQGANWSIFSTGPVVEWLGNENFQGHSLAYGANGLYAVYASDQVHSLKICYINSFGTWGPIQIVTTPGGSTALTNRRPVIAWDPVCSRYFCVYKANTNNSIFKAYGPAGGFYEMGTLQGTTGDNPYVIF